MWVHKCCLSIPSLMWLLITCSVAPPPGGCCQAPILPVPDVDCSAELPSRSATDSTFFVSSSMSAWTATSAGLTAAMLASGFVLIGFLPASASPAEARQGLGQRLLIDLPWVPLSSWQLISFPSQPPAAGQTHCTGKPCAYLFFHEDMLVLQDCELLLPLYTGITTPWRPDM